MEVERAKTKAHACSTTTRIRKSKLIGFEQRLSNFVVIRHNFKRFQVKLLVRGHQTRFSNLDEGLSFEYSLGEDTNEVTISRVVNGNREVLTLLKQHPFRADSKFMLTI